MGNGIPNFHKQLQHGMVMQASLCCSNVSPEIASGFISSKSNRNS